MVYQNTSREYERIKFGKFKCWAKTSSYFADHILVLGKKIDKKKWKDTFTLNWHLNSISDLPCKEYNQFPSMQSYQIEQDISMNISLHVDKKKPDKTNSSDYEWTLSLTHLISQLVVANSQHISI